MRPQTSSQVNSRKMSRLGSREMRFNQSRRGHVDDGAASQAGENMYDATNIPSSKFVSINDLMKQSKNNFNNTINVERETFDDTFKTLRNTSKGRGDSTENKRRILKFLAAGNDDQDEDKLIEKMNRIKPTDDNTMNKILNFA